MNKSRELAYEIHDLCKKYNATITACKDRIVINIPGERIVVLSAITGEEIEWEDVWPAAFAARGEPCLN